MSQRFLVSSPTERLLAELSHEINSPLAAIRNALYLIACRAGEREAEIRAYIALADEEAVAIAMVLRQARLEALENAAPRTFSRAA